MPQIAVRVSEEELALLDRLVAEEHFAEIDLGITGALIMAETTKDEPPWDFDDDTDPLRRVETAASELLQLVHEARGLVSGRE
ncbi:MAG TPA: hypothetical protein VNA11_02440 [Pseudonocardia sp.]|nr:hypothetical protein [Pseudonocardia sp.]